MKPPPEGRAQLDAVQRLEELLDPHAAARRHVQFRDPGPGAAKVRVAGNPYIVVWRASGDVAGVASGIRKLAEHAHGKGGGPIPLLAVPFMGDSGRRLCGEHGVNWLDLSGNARIDAPGVRIHVEGKLNRFKGRGRPSNPFAPRSSRIARWLLLHPEEFHVQKDLAAATGVGAGFVSRIVRRLEALDLVERDEAGAVRARDPRLLIEAWAEQHDFEQHHLLRGHVPARSGEELLARVSDELAGAGIEHAATGLAGAWLLTHFAGFRTVTLFVADRPGDAMLERLGFREDERGANLWLALPADGGVFHGAEMREGRPCAHPVQVWLDLKGHPERADGAAERLERTHLGWAARA